MALCPRRCSDGDPRALEYESRESSSAPDTPGTVPTTTFSTPSPRRVPVETHKSRRVGELSWSSGVGGTLVAGPNAVPEGLVDSYQRLDATFSDCSK